MFSLPPRGQRELRKSQAWRGHGQRWAQTHKGQMGGRAPLQGSMRVNDSKRELCHSQPTPQGPSVPPQRSDQPWRVDRDLT